MDDHLTTYLKAVSRALDFRWRSWWWCRASWPPCGRRATRSAGWC